MSSDPSARSLEQARELARRWLIDGYVTDLYWLTNAIALALDAATAERDAVIAAIRTALSDFAPTVGGFGPTTSTLTAWNRVLAALALTPTSVRAQTSAGKVLNACQFIDRAIPYLPAAMQDEARKILWGDATAFAPSAESKPEPSACPTPGAYDALAALEAPREPDPRDAIIAAGIRWVRVGETIDRKVADVVNAKGEIVAEAQRAYLVATQEYVAAEREMAAGLRALAGLTKEAGGG